MPIISICLIAKKDINYDFLSNQSWSNTELVVACNSEVGNKIKSIVYNNSTFKTIKIIDDISGSLENNIIECCEGEYTVWIQDNETWDSDFLTQLKDFVFHNKNNENILYISGFIKKNKLLTPAYQVYPFIKKIFSLSKIFVSPYYFIPSVKFIWNTQLIKDYGLVFDCTLDNHVLKEAIFNIDYLSTKYQVNAYCEPNYTTDILSFYNPLDEYTNNSFIKIYREKILDKRSIFLKNPWSKLFWYFLKSERHLKLKVDSWSDSST
jgi:hypothetical protein